MAAKKYRALTDLYYPTSPAVLKRLAAGEDVPFEERRVKHVAPGRIAADLPETSVAWLLKQGLIEEVEGD